MRGIQVNSLEPLNDVALSVPRIVYEFRGTGYGFSTDILEKDIP